MSNSIRVMLGLILVTVGFFWNDIMERIPDISPDEVPVVQIDRPNEETLRDVLSVASLVTENDDKTKLAIFNNVFSDRVSGYSADTQQINDVYVLAAKNVFGDSMKGKYPGYGENLNGLMRSVLGSENKNLTQNDKDQLSKKFKGLAYALTL